MVVCSFLMLYFIYFFDVLCMDIIILFVSTLVFFVNPHYNDENYKTLQNK